jgi:hypothetical protein
MKYEMLMIAAVFVMFLSQMLYTRYLFETFRRKVYLDILDFLATRGDIEEDQEPVAKNRSKHIRLVSNHEKK